MNEKELEISGGSLFYEIKDEKVNITRYNGVASEVIVPDQIGPYPVVSVGKKAFLSKKNLRKVVLPSGLVQIGEWAFAYCSNLQEVSVPVQAVAFGRAAFLECGSLCRIAPRLESYGASAFQPELLACALTVFDAYYLADLPQVGSREWLAGWDAKLVSLLHASDRSGYSKQVLCGEEDYGSTDLNAYMSRSREKKVRLSFLRLLHPTGLAASLEQELKEYLLSHTKGCETEESWNVCLREYGDDREVYSLFSEIGCVNDGNISGILEEIGDLHPEMKAYFLKMAGGESTSFFDSLEL